MRDPSYLFTKQWVRFRIDEEEISKGWAAFEYIDFCIRRAWPDYRGVEVMHTEEKPFGTELTFHVW